MYTIDQYYKQILAFTNTLTIRFLDVAIAMNKGLINDGYAVDADKMTWKYFLNISGQKHISNSDVKVTVIETGNVESLTLNLLAQFPYTKKELLKGSSFFKELLLKYPNDTLFIKGCLYPADMTDAINSIDGTILAYDTAHIEQSEYTLIHRLESFIIDYLNRWHVRAYTIVDELYLPSMLGNLYASIPNKIMNLRLEAINTNQVHSFHMEHYFRSRLNLWDEIQVLKPSTKYWLYKNLDYLMKHVGKESTFQTILTKIFDENAVGVGEYLLRLPDPVNEPDVYKIANESYYKNSEVITASNALNKSFTIDNEEDLSLDHLVTVEMTKLPDTPKETNLDKIVYEINDLKKKTEKQDTDTRKTKAITLGLTKLFKANGFDLPMLVISYWIYYVKHNLYNAIIDYNEPNIILEADTTANVDYIEPNSNQYFSVTPKVGFLLLLKQLLYVTGQHNIKLSKITFSNVLKTDKILFDNIVDNIYNDGHSSALFSELKDTLPMDPSNINDSTQLGDYISDVIEYYKLVWTLDANSESSAVSANVKQVFNKLLVEDSYDLTVNGTEYTIDELLALHDVSYTITDNFDLTLSITSIIKTFTNIMIDEYATIKERMISFTNILNKLTSYTLQVINVNNEDDTLFSYYNNHSVLRTEDGLILVLDATARGLEQEYVKIHAKGNDFRERFQANVYAHNTRMSMCKKPIKGVMDLKVVNNEIEAYNLIPYLTVHMSNDYVCDITPLKFKDDFLKEIKASFEPYSTFTGSVGSTANDFRDYQTGYVDNTALVKSHDVEEVTINVTATIEDINKDIVGSVTHPDMTVDIYDVELD